MKGQEYMEIPFAKQGERKMTQYRPVFVRKGALVPLGPAWV
jgi:hypothetical protein